MSEHDDTPPDEVPNLTLRLVRDTRADIATMLRTMEGMRADLSGVEHRVGGVEQRLGGVEHRLGHLEGRVEVLEDRVGDVERASDGDDDG